MRTVNSDVVTMNLEIPMNKDNLYDNTLENLVDYYAACCIEFVNFGTLDGDYVIHAPSEVLEVILDKFEPRAR